MFVDRDGVINRKAVDGQYVTDWKAFEFLPRALEGLRLLADSPLSVIVVTNQRGVALGRMTPDALTDIHRNMLTTVAAAGARIDAVYHCPHDVGCRCRKPDVGMFEQAARDFRLRLTETAVIGDQMSDMVAGQRIGALNVLISAEPSCLDARSQLPAVDHVAPNLAEAAVWLLDSVKTDGERSREAPSRTSLG